MYYGRKYSLKKNDKIIIYGAATTGAILYKNFIEANLDVIAFIDKRADETPLYYELPVWTLEQLKKYLCHNQDVVIVIGIKNVFEHEKIARKIYEIGGKRIVFRPYKELNGQGNEDGGGNFAEDVGKQRTSFRGCCDIVKYKLVRTARAVIFRQSNR